MSAIQSTMNDLRCTLRARPVAKNGHAHPSKHRSLCRGCGEQFPFESQIHRGSSEQVALVEPLLSKCLSHDEMSGATRRPGRRRHRRAWHGSPADRV